MVRAGCLSCRQRSGINCAPQLHPPAGGFAGIISKAKQEGRDPNMNQNRPRHANMNSLIRFPNRRIWHAGVMLIAASVTALSAAAIPVQSFHKNTDGVTFTMSPGKMKLTVCSDSIVRVMYSPNAALPAGQDFVVTNHSWRSTSFKVAEADGRVMVTTRKLKVAVDKASGALAFYDAAGKLLLGEPAGRRQDDDAGDGERRVVLSTGANFHQSRR